MLNPYPALTYRLPFKDCRPQAVHGAERPGACMLAAFASYLREEPITGAGRALSRDQLLRVFQSAAATIGVPWERMHRWCGGINGSMVGPVSMESIIGLKPSRYQALAAGKLTTAGGILAMGVGLGKTLTTMVAVRELSDSDPSLRRRCWIVAPLSALPAWKPYLEWLRSLYEDVQLVSVDSAHKLKGADRSAGGVLIVDEAHYAGHHDARRTKALHAIRLAFDACICLTGTLLHSGIEAAMNVLDLAIPGSTGFSTKWTAGEYFGCIEKFALSTGRTVAKVVKPAGAERQKFLDYVARYVIALDKHSPEVANDITIPEQHLFSIDLDGADDDSETAAVDCLVRLARAHLDAGEELPHASMLAHEALGEGVSEKLDWLLDRLADDAEHESVAVFAEYHDTLDAAERRLTEAGVSYVRVDGSVTGPAREAAVAAFQAGTVRVFLGQIDATGLSINLFRAHVSVALDPTQRAPNYAQMLGRTCRRGQAYECHHYDLAANPVQRICISRLRAGESFNTALARIAETATTKATL